VGRYKFEDLDKLMKKLTSHSKKGDVDVSVDPRIGSIVISYSSNVDTETTIEIYPSELNKFVTIKEEKWL
jgi:hypothetical protein